VDQAILVTQNFHLTRAMFLCDQLGIDSTGVKSDQGYYLKRSRLYWNIREIFATFNAVWDVWVIKPIPVLGEELPIL
jgi:SanA protein